MDPAVDVLTIYPAAWAALFQGLAEGLTYGLVGVASAILLAAVVTSALSRRYMVGPTLESLAETSPDGLDSIVPAVYRPIRQHGRRRRRRA
ncbi:MAG: hypothetical protein AB7P40_23025 [Chloroflexota bacterium]